jgi:hypothetical protein
MMLAIVLCLGLVPILGACDATARLGGPRSGQSFGGGSGGGDEPPPQIDPSLVGAWQRVLILTSSSGDLLRTETTWIFRADGSATRRVDVIDFGRSLADVFESDARWRVVDGAVVIDWEPPLSGTLRLDYFLAADGRSVVLGFDRYLRVF